MHQFSPGLFIMLTIIAEVSSHIRGEKGGTSIIFSRIIRRLASSFDIPEVKHAISIDNKWSEPLVLIWEWEMRPLITLLTQLFTMSMMVIHRMGILFGKCILLRATDMILLCVLLASRLLDRDSLQKVK